MGAAAGRSGTAVVLLTRDLRVHDHPALAAAARRCGQVAPLFVLDDRILGGAGGSPNRRALLHDALVDLRAALRARGGDLVVARGDPAAEAVALARHVGADRVLASADVSALARRRQGELARACAAAGLDLELHPGTTVVPPDELRTTGGRPYQVFTPYWRAWAAHPWRDLAPTPRRLALPPGVAVGRIPGRAALAAGPTSPELAPGGEVAARARLAAFARTDLAAYGRGGHDDLAGDRTSRLSPHLHLGALSAREVAARLGGRPGGEAVVRQLAWRDFFHQDTAAHPDIAHHDLRPRRGRRFRDDPGALAAWEEGRTGFPIVDAGMRQLRHEGWMHNRTRLVTASFLTRALGLDWRLGAAHFLSWLADGDVADNSGNWQWVAGTGRNPRPGRALNPLRQAARFDPEGRYVRRWVPELAEVPGPAVHRPWALPEERRRALRYPPPLVEPW